MKTKKLDKKLALNKLTVSNLNTIQAGAEKASLGSCFICPTRIDYETCFLCPTDLTCGATCAIMDSVCFNNCDENPDH